MKHSFKCFLSAGSMITNSCRPCGTGDEPVALGKEMRFIAIKTSSRGGNRMKFAFIRTTISPTTRK